jgi:predicted nucleic acid-binding protein
VAFVLDASASLPWCFRDEATPESDLLQARAASGERIVVPGHWPAEILTGVPRAARRGRINDPSVDAFLDALPLYDIVVDARPMPEQWAEALQLTRQHRLSGYDAMYLALAKRLNIGLATLDGRLRDAATSEGVLLVV